MTWRDPIVEEIRAIREAHAAKFNYDIDAIFEDLQRRERESGRTFVSLPPKRIIPTVMKIKVREMLRLPHDDGWQEVRQTGSHRHLRHATKPGTVTVAGKMGETMHPKTAATILKQAGLQS